MSERPDLPGYARTILPNGTGYSVIHYSADPTHDEDWEAETFRGMPPRVRRREYGLDEDVTDGIPVWEGYVDQMHTVKAPRIIPVVSASALYGGWDCGTARMPAFELLQVTPRSKQLQWILEVVPERPMSMEIFAPRVRAKLRSFLPGDWNRIVHVGDFTVKTKGGAREESAQDVARQHGFRIKEISNSWAGREEAVEFFLSEFCDQDGPQESWKPRMVYSEVGCPVLVAGMQGAYCVQTRAGGGADHGPGAEYKPQPAKNFFSHANDAHQYPLVHLLRMFRGRPGARRTRRI